MFQGIRFASIPKCASRSLKALGLLGELEGRCHTKITEYPEWEKYQWFAVDRPEAEWMESWWMECQRTKSMFADWLGFKYQNMEVDLAKLLDPPIGIAPRRPGLNQWIPEDFTVDFIPRDVSFKEYAFAKITDGVPCTRIQIADLDIHLMEMGYTPVHMNKREIHASC